MAAESAVLVTIAKSLASGLLKEISLKAINLVSESSTTEGLKLAIFGGLGPELRRLEKEITKLDAVLCRAEGIDPMQCDNNNLVLVWLRSVKNAACFADNLLDEASYEKMRRKVEAKRGRFKRVQLQVAKLSSRSDASFAFRMRIARKVKLFMSMIDEIYKEAETTLRLAELSAELAPIYQHPTTISTENLRDLRENPDTSLVIGRQADEELIVRELCGPDNGNDLHVVAIVGRSGVGKTTLARKVYDNKTVVEHFGRRSWIFVFDHFKLERLLNEMLQSVTGQNHNLSNKGAMEEKLQQCLQKERTGYLLVLDDVWNTDEQLWKSVESCFVRVTRFTRTRVLVTTQSSNVASIMSVSLALHLKDLDDADAWILFKGKAFANKSEERTLGLEDVGRRILSKCGGLPLAIKTLGSLLASMDRKTEWESIERSELWGLSIHQSVIIPWLLLSFHHLPNATIKQCFVHCSIIMEKGTVVQQSKLIQAWMAQGFIQSKGETGMSMEEIGGTYVTTLVANGLLQTDIRSNGCNLWMHDLIHDLTLFISKDTCLIVREADDLQIASELEHLRRCGESTSGSKYVLPKGETISKLHTLICTQTALSVDFAARARSLRDLRLIGCNLKEVPSSIGRLKHLRYLSLCENPFRYLPESIGTLFNLQTIDLEQCTKLIALPSKITGLFSLRHILITRFVRMPKGMGQLTCLRTLPRITLEQNEGFKIKELRSLPLLSGEVAIRGLDHICCKEDAMETSLKTKEGITDLSLVWPFYFEQQQTHMVSNDEETMDGLHPHSNLKRIVVRNFGGTRISPWLSYLNNLKSINLYSCNRCEQLPELGQLRSLVEILICRMDSLEDIGIDFYKNDDGRTAYSSRILFPQLKRFHLKNMQKLIDWVQPSGSPYVIFPCLEELEIDDCPLLVSAPTCFQSLVSLSIRRIRSAKPLLMILRNGDNLTALHISAVEQLTSLSCPFLKCPSLKSIKISDCRELSELCPTLQHMSSLVDLKVMSCDSLAFFPDIEGLLSLRTLTIMWCENLSTLSGVESCVSIEALRIRNAKLYLIPNLTRLSHLTTLTLTHFSCQTSIPGCLSHLSSLRSLKIGGFSQELHQLCGVGHLPKCLKELNIYGWSKINSLPSELQFFNQLEFLGIVGFDGVETLPEWLGNLFSLQELYISSCERLKNLPPVEAMRRLTQLTRLSIFHCPLLSERCSVIGGDEWHKIAYLSFIKIDDQMIQRTT